nr:MAG TPA: hypothetical protein [Caudoviricetes sp.]
MIRCLKNSQSFLRQRSHRSIAPFFCTWLWREPVRTV